MPDSPCTFKQSATLALVEAREVCISRHGFDGMTTLEGLTDQAQLLMEDVAACQVGREGCMVGKQLQRVQYVAKGLVPGNQRRERGHDEVTRCAQLEMQRRYTAATAVDVVDIVVCTLQTQPLAGSPKCAALNIPLCCITTLNMVVVVVTSVVFIQGQREDPLGADEKEAGRLVPQGLEADRDLDPEEGSVTERVAEEIQGSLIRSSLVSRVQIAWLTVGSSSTRPGDDSRYSSNIEVC